MQTPEDIKQRDIQKSLDFVKNEVIPKANSLVKLGWTGGTSDRFGDDIIPAHMNIMVEECKKYGWSLIYCIGYEGDYEVCLKYCYLKVVPFSEELYRNPIQSSWTQKKEEYNKKPWFQKLYS